ncbi:MAG: sulfotransferase [Thiogranum sp.]
MKKPQWMLKLAIPALAAVQGARKTPVFLVGTQRSGTTMLTDILGRVPLCRAYHEGDERVMSDMRLRERGVIRDVINEEIRPFQVFKPINDSQHTEEILDIHDNALAVWIYREYNDVVNSALAKWAAWQRRIILWICENYDEQETPVDEPDKWFAIYKEHMSRDTAQALRGCVGDDISDEEGAALLWFIRNQLYFDQGLEDNARVLLVKYEDMVSRPRIYIKRVFDFAGCAFKDRYVQDVRTTSIAKKDPPALRQSIRDLCDGLQQRLDSAYKQQTGAGE